MGEIVLNIQNITKSFSDEQDKTQVLKGISLAVEKGEFVTLLGASGCGKTTLLRIIAGLEYPDGGEILLDGKNITKAEPYERNVNMIFQNYALFPHMTVEENIGYGLKLQKVDKAEIKKRVQDMLSLVQLEGYEKRMPDKLSGGQRQRVAIARAIINNPKVLLLDEPLGALDLKLRRQMQLELKRLQKKLGITFIYITHDQEEALNMSDRIAVMRGGLFEQLGTPNEIYDHPKTAYVARFVGSANILTLGGKCLAVRSEALELKKDAEGYLSGVVREKSFAGGMLRIAVETESCGELVASRHGIDSPLAPGDTVGISWADGAAVEVQP